MKALPILGAAVLFATLTSNGFAEDPADRYWVVGSFKTLVSATRESARIENITGFPVRIARFDLPSGRLYRLVIEQDANPDEQKRLLEDQGIDTWSVPLYARQLDFEQQVDEPVTGMAHHLVIGAYEDRARATDHAERLRDLGNDNAVVLEAGSDLYRVALGPFAGRDREAKRIADAMGIAGAWWLETAGQVVMKKASPGKVEERVATRSMRRSVTEPEVPEEKEQPVVPKAPPISPPRPGESYIDYCSGRATAREREMFCQNGRFATHVTDGASGSTLIEFCASASASERARYCDNQTFAARVLP